MRWIVLTVVLFTIHCSLFTIHAVAQRFFNLKADEVRIDTLLPVFNYAYPLGPNYADSTYEVTIEYPEFIPMESDEIERYAKIRNEELGISNYDLPAMPEISQSVSVDRKRGTLHIGFIPLVYRDGQYQKLVSFKLSIHGISNEQLVISNYDYYTLDGRKLQGKPTKKGIYIVNGKKVVVK